MTTLEYINAFVIPSALAIIPEARMSSPEARAMLLAIGLQESGFAYRRQVKGPARSFWEFEKSGINGVLAHPASAPFIAAVLPTMVVRSAECYDAIEQNDILACVFARLLLWTHPHILPRRHEPAIAWTYYTATWRPGKPRREAWDGNFARAWGTVE